MNYPCNLLLYGPPGTGKTFNTVNYAVAIIEDRPLDDVRKDNYDVNLEKYNRYMKMGRVFFITFHQAMSYDEFIEGIKPVIVDGNVQYMAKPGVFYKFCKMADNPPLCNEFDDQGRCVFVIDEINRGNVSNIFGELITLLESSRRRGKKECIESHLSLMDEYFSVPQNVYIIGTMNSSDRSLTSLDAALRRRFQFVEMLPDSSVLDRKVGDIHLGKLLDEMNRRIALSYDRDHMFGHAFFMDVRTMDDLAICFKKKIIPQLQELFFDDYRKMANVLGRANDPDECPFVRPKPRTEFQEKFDYADVYEIVDDRRVFYNQMNYIRIYDDRPQEDQELI